MIFKRTALLLAALTTGCAHTPVNNHTSGIQPPHAHAAPAGTGGPAAASERAERIRSECINGRRIICGRVLQVTKDGLVVESGYVDLLRQPLTQSWVMPANISAKRDPDVLELNTPGTPCIGLVFLTNIPKRPKVANYDYVAITGYPAGEYTYAPVPNVRKDIRRFSASLAVAVKLILQAEK